MKKASMIIFTVDLEKVDVDIFNKLLKLGSYESMGFEMNRWTFPIAHIKDVEKAIGDRVIFSMKHLREHVLELESVNIGTGQIFIGKGKDESKVAEFMRMKDTVEHVLKYDTRARASDTWLYFKVLQEVGYVVDADYKVIHDLPKYETISRIRRKFQQGENGLYKADAETIEIRKEYERETRRMMADSEQDWFNVEAKS